jgi:hypothetical protein
MRQDAVVAYFTNYCPGIRLEGLRKIKKISSMVSNLVESRTWYLTTTRHKRYHMSQPDVLKYVKQTLQLSEHSHESILRTCAYRKQQP